MLSGRINVASGATKDKVFSLLLIPPILRREEISEAPAFSLRSTRAVSGEYRFELIGHVIEQTGLLSLALFSHLIRLKRYPAN